MGEAKGEWPCDWEAEWTRALEDVGCGTDKEHEVPKMMLEPMMEKRTLRQMSKSYVSKEVTKGHLAGPQCEKRREVSAGWGREGHKERTQGHGGGKVLTPPMTE